MIRGIDLSEGRAALAALSEEIWWRARSPMLCAACATALPGFHFQPTTEEEAQAAPRADDGARVGLAFIRDPATEAWATAHGIRLLMPSRELALRVGDKLELGALAAEAGVRTPASTIVREASPGQAARLWSDAGERPLVAQLGSDGHSGAGTCPVRSSGQLAKLLRHWRGLDLKLSELVEGMPITASGCVGADRTLVSGLSHQLVGFPQLTHHWATHCGNQLLCEGDVDPGLVADAEGSCRRLGEALRRRGFRGMFGIDAIAGPDGVAVIEINARIQSVSSLAGVAELGHGLLPAPGTHVLAHALDELPPEREGGPPRQPLSQAVVYAETGTTVESGLAAGAYRLDDDDELVLVSAEGRLDRIGDEEALVWPFVAAGEEIEPGTKLAVIQLTQRVAPVADGRALLPVAARWVTALRRRLHARVPAAAGAR